MGNVARVAYDIVVLNGGSSSGKSTIARCLQTMLPRPWLRLGVDDLIDAMPPAEAASEPLIDFRQDGAVVVHDGFRELEDAWNRGIAAIAGAGTGVIVEDVFTGGEQSQTRLRAAFTGRRVLWVAVRCTPDVAERRERTRSDRVPGMARAQADSVHTGVTYDLEVDTSRAAAADCAATIAQRLA
jgi:chloramphenicol 3-O phosphotransferase